MQLTQCSIFGIRNLLSTSLNFNPNFNIFYGINGSGKTSILEAIYILGTGKSFKTPSINNVINFNQQSCIVAGKVASETTGIFQEIDLKIERNRNGNCAYKIANTPEYSAAKLAEWLPLILINISSSLLIEGGPMYRRQFLDWGAFHVEPHFLENWRSMKRALLQRNAQLKSLRKSDYQIYKKTYIWDEAFIEHAKKVDEARKNYLDKFHPILTAMIEKHLNVKNLHIQYYCGWQGINLAEELLNCRKLDFYNGYTNKGPHRADIIISLDNKLIKNILSRGQIKLFSCIMLLAQAKLLQSLGKTKKNKSILLIDDLQAELDILAYSSLLNMINQLECQVFLTVAQETLPLPCLTNQSCKTFHVEQGVIH